MLRYLAENESRLQEGIVVCNVRDQKLAKVGIAHPQITNYGRNSVTVAVVSSLYMDALMAEGDVSRYFNDGVPGCKQTIATLHGLSIDPQVGYVSPTGFYSKNLRSRNPMESERLVEEDVVAGFSFFVHAFIFRRLGASDIEFSLDIFEGIVFSVRVQQAGHKYRVRPEVHISGFPSLSVSPPKMGRSYKHKTIGAVFLCNRSAT